MLKTKSFASRVAASCALAILALVALLPQACSGIGGVGDRCNPNRSTDECNGGLACTTNDCGVSVCCPPNVDANSPPECQKAQADCPADGGAAGAGGDGGQGGMGGSGGASGQAGIGGSGAFGAGGNGGTAGAGGSGP